MSENHETACKLADEFMKKALEETWPATSGTSSVPDWVADAAKRMCEMTSAECLVHVMRLTSLAAKASSAGKTGKQALQSFNLALAKCQPFMDAMRRIHEAKDAHRDDAAWFKSLQVAADAVPMPWETDPEYFLTKAPEQ